MKEISFNQKGKPGDLSTFNKKYYVHLAGYGFRYFTSERKQKDFIASFNRILNNTLFELNEIYVLVWTDYRKVWIYHDGSFEPIIHEISLLFDRITTVRGTNAGAFIIRDMLLIFDLFDKWTTSLETTYRKKDRWPEARRLSGLDQRLYLLRQELIDFMEISD